MDIDEDWNCVCRWGLRAAEESRRKELTRKEAGTQRLKPLVDSLCACSTPSVSVNSRMSGAGRGIIRVKTPWVNSHYLKEGRYLSQR